MPPMIEVEARIREFILEEFAEGDAIEITADMHLIEEGIVDSLGIFILVGFLEQEYGVSISEEDLDVDNFASLTTIARLVAGEEPT